MKNAILANELWKSDPCITYSAHSSCWVFECHGIQHYFSSHFCEVRLLHLAFKHALPAHPHNKSTAILGFIQACTLWKYGIRWSSTSFIEGLVSVDDNQVAVLLRCREGKEVELAHTRSQLIKEVLTTKNEICRNTETTELFVPNPTFPVNTDPFIPFANLTYSIAHHKEGVVSSNNTIIKLHNLLHFEPYMYLPTECLSDLYSIHPQPRTLTQPFIKSFAAAIVKLSANNFSKNFNDFCTMFGVSSLEVESTSSHLYQQTQNMFYAWKEKNRRNLPVLEGTYG